MKQIIIQKTSGVFGRRVGIGAGLLLVMTALLLCQYSAAADSGPVIIAVAPDTGHAGFVYQLSVSGERFTPGLSADLSFDDYTINASSIEVISDTRLTIRIGLPSDAKPGLYQLSVRSPDGIVERLNQAFHVQPPAPPILFEAEPAFQKPGTLVPVTISGNYLRSGGLAEFTHGEYTLPVTNLSVSIKTVNGTVFVPVDAPSGLYNLTVSNPDGQAGHLEEALMVTSLPRPDILAITPDQGDLDKPVQVVVTGSNFLDGATFSLSRRDKSIPGERITIELDNQISGTVLIPSHLPEGLWDVVVTNPDGQKAVKTDAFLGGSPYAPFGLHISPAWAIVGTSREVTIQGMSFLEGDRVSIRNGNDIIHATDIRLLSSREIACIIPVPKDAKTGSWDVYVTNRYDRSDIIRGGFSIYGSSTLVLGGMQPDTVDQGEQFCGVLSGYNLRNNTGVSLTADGKTPISGVISGPVSGESLPVCFTIPKDAMADFWDLTITTPGGTSITKERAMRITVNKTPVIMTITPDRAQAGIQNLKIQVDGTRFGDDEFIDLALTLNNTTIPISGAKSYRDNLITGYLTIPGDAEKGWYNLTATRDAGMGRSSTESEFFRVL